MTFSSTSPLISEEMALDMPITLSIPRRLRFTTWSSMSEMIGQTTNDMPGVMSESSWKTTDFPLPVGSSTTVSCRRSPRRMASSWPSRKSSKRKMYWSRKRTASKLKLTFGASVTRVKSNRGCSHPLGRS